LRTSGPLKAFQEGVAFHEQGRFQEAEQRYQIVLEADSRHFGALYRLGLMRLQQGRHVEAADRFRRAVKVDKTSADAHHQLALALTSLGRQEEAVAHYRKALAIRPKDAAIQNNLGSALHMFGRSEEAIAHFEQALAITPDLPQAHCGLANALHALGRSEQAVIHFRTALAVSPKYAEAHNNLGNALHALGRSQEAIFHFRSALEIRPAFAEAHNNLGTTLHASGQSEAAIAHLEQALAIKPNFAQAHYNLGNALQALKRHQEALARYDKALAITPDYVEVLNNRGNVLQELNRPEEALASYDKAVAIRPNYAEALYSRGNALQELKRLEQALASYDKALAIRPNYAGALYSRGNLLQGLNRPEEALDSYNKALTIRPDYVEALNNHGNVLQELKRPEEALASYDKALAIRAEYPEGFNNRGNVLQTLNRPEEALASYRKAFAIRPDCADALYNCGNLLQKFKRHDEALACYDKVLAVKPDHPYAFSAMANSALQSCDWTRTWEIAAKLVTHVKNRTAIVEPFTLLGYGYDPSLQLECAKTVGQHIVRPEPLWKGTIWRNEKIRIAYLSSDFRWHATATLITELIELHSRSHFEVLGISYGPDDGSSARTRLIKAFDQFQDVRLVTDREVAKRMKDLQVDIAIDLNGYTTHSRPGILAHRPAPIQVNYLGYPGTMAVDFIDYIIADRIVLPLDQQPFYVEKIVHLPDCFQVNDSNRKIAARMPVRREVGLPDQGFVFCCFNNSWKITASIFDVWMRLLQSVEGSVLWLLHDNDIAMMHLRSEASARGVDPARLVFAGRINLDSHLARQRLADLFLDTVPINAGTTASDALWAGLPVLTCCAGPRIAASLLHAIGLPDMVANGLEDYEALALRLAGDPSLLGAIRRRLEQNRISYPLFDTPRFRDHIEAAYTKMWELWQHGDSPQSFSVDGRNASVQN